MQTLSRALTLILFVPTIALAQTYKCKLPNGSTSFQDQPCQAGSTASELSGRAEVASSSSCRYFDAFVDNHDGTMTDPRSGLVWQRCALGQSWLGGRCSGSASVFDWSDAMDAAKANNFLGKTDWRLPTLSELQAVVGKHENCLVDKNPRQSRAVSRMFPPVESDGYVGTFWSSTPFTSSGAWIVLFIDGSSYSVGSKSVAPITNARLVRK
jgi:hypothetical protein